MNIYTVSFFGHREIERPIEIENRLDKLLYDLITQKEYVKFLIGRDGDFDLLASSAKIRCINSFVLLQILASIKLDALLDNEKIM